MSLGALVGPFRGRNVLDSAGNYYLPTLITYAKQDSEKVQGEVFGPVPVAVAPED